MLAICMTSPRYKNSRAVCSRNFDWLCEVFTLLTIALKYPDDICTCFQMSLRSICMFFTSSEDLYAILACMCIWLCAVFAWLPIGLEIREGYLHVFSCSYAPYLYGFQCACRLMSGICTCCHAPMHVICMASASSNNF